MNTTSSAPSGRLALPLDRMQERYDVVVVGSGYGGSVAASRLARRGRSVCLLERGRERHPGEYPDTLARAAREVQVRRGRRRRGSPTGLFELVADDEVSVLVGCGLGGTSIINAGVALRPPDWVFDDPRWPVALRGQGAAALDPWFERAEHMLGSVSYPDDPVAWPVPAKHRALELAAQTVGATVDRPKINVAFRDGTNAAGVEMTACTLCGDCVAGCNHGAKGTLLTNYLPDAVAHGAHLFTETSVRTVLPAPGGGWTVTFESLADGRPRLGSPSLFVRADVVVLAAGTLGSTETLFRSRAQGLPVSSRLGERFSGNGDALAFAYDADVPVRGIGAGRWLRPRDESTGPCITGAVELTDRPETGHGLLIEEGAIPGALAGIMPTAFALAADPGGHGGGAGVATRLVRGLRAAAATVAGRGDRRADRTLTYLVMSDDSGDGRLRAEGDTVIVDWVGAGDHPVFDASDSALRRATAGIGATFVRNPLWTPSLNEPLVSVHPLGGCAMADDGGGGVVDDRGRVFTGDGTEVHDGLLVVDGAIVPRPLVANPLLTITALAERACDLLAEERGWPEAGTGGAASPVPASGPAPTRPGLRFTERMRGWAGPTATGDPRAGVVQGREDGTPIEFVLTVGIDDLPALLADPSRPGTLAGTVTAPALAPRRLRAVEGSFRLMQRDPTHVETWHMRYSMVLAADDGRRFRFEGTKVLHDRAGLDAWSDTTTLQVTVADDATGEVLIAGIMRLGAGDLARQMRTMRVTGVAEPWRRWSWLARFSAGFLRSLTNVYGGPLDNVGHFPTEPRHSTPLTGRGARRLRLPAPEPRWCDGRGRWHDGAEPGPDGWLRLTRFEGGRRGPVVLAPGFGMSATSFLGDTIETNLVEHLVEKGYDTWLLDYRASIDLPSARTSFTLDDIARRDWPTAVAEVLRVTGAGSVQALGHCVGSVSLMMALASELRGVRSAVCMQYTLHPVSSFLNRAKVALGVGKLLDRVLDHVAPLRGRSALNTVIDLGLRAVPMPSEERCGKAVCRWVNAIYGCTHAHDQLDEATHDRIEDLFGVGNLAALDHMGVMVRHREAVDHTGASTYTAHPERLRLPILLVQGERNYIFRPQGSLRTLRWLQASNGSHLYDRVVLPGYAHLDALIGRDAPAEVFPVLSRHLDAFNH